jgi:hypothetical protein
VERSPPLKILKSARSVKKFERTGKNFFRALMAQKIAPEEEKIGRIMA